MRVPALEGVVEYDSGTSIRDVDQRLWDGAEAPHWRHEMALAVGKQAPDFTLPDQDGKPVKLSDFKGKRVVLFFYPKASTPG
jgi:hypothetical protein